MFLYCNRQVHRDVLITLYNVTLRLFHATIVAVEKQDELNILSVCLKP
jgi:hypothetical protein